MDEEYQDQEPRSKLAEELEHEVVVKNHMLKGTKDECGYCGQAFGPDENVIEKTIFGIVWRFCSEECYRDFQDSSNFKDDEFDNEKKNDQGKVFIDSDDE